jgi:hypothetical protein
LKTKLPCGRHALRPADLIRLAIPCGLALNHAYAATDFELAGAAGSFKADVTIGTQFRTSSPSAELLNGNNAATLGRSGNPSGATGRNNDDGNLNFKRGDQTATVAKILLESSLKGDVFEGVVKAKAWYDYQLSDGGVPYGNSINGYTAGEALGQHGASSLARASGISLLDAYVKAKMRLGTVASDVSIGNQILTGWGERFAFGGGLSALQPRDFATAARPGALPGEIFRPFPMIALKAASADLGSVEAFYQLGRAENALPLCGTFASPADFQADGCNKVYVGPGSDASRDLIGQYLTRPGNLHASDRGQYGLAYRFTLEPIKTQVSLHYANYASRMGLIGVTKSTNPTNPLINGDPLGSNASYFLEYPEDIRVFGLGFNSQIGKTKISGELTYRPNQPVSLNGPDILNAFASYSAATPLRSAAQNAPLGQPFHGFDRFKLSQLQLAATHAFDNVIGAQEFTLYGEVGVRHVDGLPDVNEMRYGRATVFGIGPIGGVCQGGSTKGSAQCSTDGFASSTMWGYRLRGSARYAGAIFGADLVPTLSFGQDVKGWSDEGVFNQGRKIMNLSVRAIMNKKYWVDMTAQSAWGGTYDPMRDRDFVNLSIGASF